VSRSFAEGDPQSFTRAVVVESVGPLTTVQDLGRPGLAHLGVTRSGAADRAGLRLANRLVGNHDGAAAFEVTLGGFALTTLVAVTVAVTGADCPVRVDGRPAPANAPLSLGAGSTVELGTATRGLRAYVAVRGGIDVPVVLGSRSYDTLAGLGPRPIAGGDLVALGSVPGWQPGRVPHVDVAPVPGLPAPTDVVTLRAVAGPRVDRLTTAGLERLWATTWHVSPHSDRVAVRLAGDELARARVDELPSEGLVRGAVQLLPSGRPVVFLADHPVTGGYPVVAVLRDDDVDRAAQLRPGQPLRLVS
jgi:biotin-dependent carboxylase-like uncharacterized protein